MMGKGVDPPGTVIVTGPDEARIPERVCDEVQPHRGAARPHQLLRLGAHETGDRRSRVFEQLGRLGGEGWAEQSQYLVPGQLSGEEARLLAALGTTPGAPEDVPLS